MTTANKKPIIDWAKGDSILSEKLNVFGSLFLLLSFTIQTFLFNNWDDKIKKFEQANRDYTEFTRASLEYQNLYLGLESQNDSSKLKFQTAFIRAAAEKYRIGKIISTNVNLFENKSEVEQFINNTNELFKELNQVKDLNSLYKFVELVEIKIPENQQLKANWINKII